jgi:hypothetical protein
VPLFLLPNSEYVRGPCTRHIFTRYIRAYHQRVVQLALTSARQARRCVCIRQHTLATARLPELSAVAETRQKGKCQHRVDTFGLAVLNKGVNVRVPSEFAQCQCDVLVA